MIAGTAKAVTPTAEEGAKMNAPREAHFFSVPEANFAEPLYYGCTPQGRARHSVRAASVKGAQGGAHGVTRPTLGLEADQRPARRGYFGFLATAGGFFF